MVRWRDRPVASCLSACTLPWQLGPALTGAACCLGRKRARRRAHPQRRATAPFHTEIIRELAAAGVRGKVVLQRGADEECLKILHLIREGGGGGSGGGGS